MSNSTKTQKRLIAIFLVALFSVFATSSNLVADGTHTLGTPLISYPDSLVTGVVTAGTGLAEDAKKGDVITITVPANSEIKEVWLYLQGYHTVEGYPGDDTVTVTSVLHTPLDVDGKVIAVPAKAGNPIVQPAPPAGTPYEVTGVRIGGENDYFDVGCSAYRFDITDLGIVKNGLNKILVSNADGFDLWTNGAGIVVFYYDNVDGGMLQVRDGNDYALDYEGNPTPDYPELTVMEKQTFTFEARNVDRIANLNMFFNSVSGIYSFYRRPTSIEVTVGGNVLTYSNVLDSHDGDEWDTLELNVDLPAGVNTLSVQGFSRDDFLPPFQTARDHSIPASFSWNFVSLQVLDKAPTCDTGGPYNVTCEGEMTKIDLTSMSTDPEGVGLTHSWETDCDDAVLENADTASPTLGLSIPGTGSAQNCNVYLTISDGENTRTCETEVSATACELDCWGTPWGKAQYDQCGVCDGNNACFDCADVPFGKSILDPNEECCLPEDLDECGLCFGDGSTCKDPECETFTVLNTISTLTNVNKKHNKMLRAWGKKVNRACKREGSRAQRREARRLKKKAFKTSSNFVQSSSFVSTIPTTYTVCEGDVVDCVSTDNAINISSYTTYSNEARKQIFDMVNLEAQCRAGDGICRDFASKCLERLRDRINTRRGYKRKAKNNHSEIKTTVTKLPNPIISCE